MSRNDLLGPSKTFKNTISASSAPIQAKLVEAGLVNVLFYRVSILSFHKIFSGSGRFGHAMQNFD